MSDIQRSRPVAEVGSPMRVSVFLKSGNQFSFHGRVVQDHGSLKLYTLPPVTIPHLDLSTVEAIIQDEIPEEQR